MAAFFTFGVVAFALTGDATFLAGATLLAAGDLAAFLAATGCTATASTTLVSSAIVELRELVVGRREESTGLRESVFLPRGGTPTSKLFADARE